MNKILLFLLGGCIIGSAITIFSAQNKHKKIPTQQNAESKQNTQQEDRISTISPNILLGFHLGMSKLEYNSLIKQYKNSGKMSIWDNNTYCMHWFETQNITVHDNSVGNFTSTQSFSIIFDIQPKFVNNKLHTLSMLIEPLYDDTILVQTSNIILLKNHLSKILGSQPPLNSFHWTFSIIVIIPIIGRSSSGMSYSERIMLKRNIITNIRHPIFIDCIWNNDMLQFFQKEKTKSMIIFKNAINL